MTTIMESEQLSFLLNTVVYLGVSFVLFLVGRILYDALHRKIDVKHELTGADNMAFALAYVGYFVALILVIGSAVIGPSNGLGADVFDILFYGLFAIILLNISAWMNDKFILRKFSIQKEIVTDQNSGTGMVVAANFIASGLIIFGAISGESTDVVHGIQTALIFWAVGQVAMILTSLIYNWITPYDIHEHIEKDNVGVGIAFSGALIAIAMLICSGIYGEFQGWEATVETLVYDVLIGLAVLPLIRWLTDKILLPGRKLTDELINQEKSNTGAGLIEGFAYVGGAALLIWCL